MGEGRSVWKGIVLQRCLFSIPAGLVQEQCSAWGGVGRRVERLWSRWRVLDMEKVSYDKGLTSCAALTQLAGIMPAGSW